MFHVQSEVPKPEAGAAGIWQAGVVLVSELVISTAILLFPVCHAAEKLNIEFSLDTDISIGTIRPTLKLAEFGDDREISGTVLTADYMLDAPLADIVRNAIAEGFTSGGVILVADGEDMLIVGNVLSTESRIIQSNGVATIELTISTEIELRNASRTIWKNTLFGRGTALADDGMAAAFQASLQRQVRELFGDDYFLIELQ